MSAERTVMPVGFSTRNGPIVTSYAVALSSAALAAVAALFAAAFLAVFLPVFLLTTSSPPARPRARTPSRCRSCRARGAWSRQAGTRRRRRRLRSRCCCRTRARSGAGLRWLRACRALADPLGCGKRGAHGSEGSAAAVVGVAGNGVAGDDVALRASLADSVPPALESALDSLLGVGPRVVVVVGLLAKLLVRSVIRERDRVVRDVLDAGVARGALEALAIHAL